MTYRVQNITDAKRWNDFLELPKMIYRKDANWVPPLNTEITRVLNTEANPYFQEAELETFVCYRSGLPIARSVVVINKKHWSRWNKKTAFFGFFETTNDAEGVATLFEKMEQYCSAHGAESLEGPFNPNHYSEMGILIDNFIDPPAFFETYNPAYYAQVIEQTGFNILKKIHTRINRNTDKYVIQNSKPLKVSSKKNGFSIRPFNLFSKARDLEKIREINNNAFSNNWNFLPLTKEEYIFASRYLFFATKPRLVLIVEHDHKPAGVIQCMLNVNKLLKPLNGRLNLFDYPTLLFKRSSINEIVIHAIGIKKEYQNTVAFRLILDKMCSIVQHYPVVSTSWITDDNLPAIRASELLGLKPYKWFAIYEKKL